VFLILALLLLLLLPSPWHVVGALAAGVLAVLEIGFWMRRVRPLAVSTGKEGLLGATGVAVETLAPRGQVEVRGELWEAHAAEDVPSGTQVKVTAVEGLLLEVERNLNGTGPPAA
jgi:membrane-bound serine protease (ClpP class)